MTCNIERLMGKIHSIHKAAGNHVPDELVQGFAPEGRAQFLADESRAVEAAIPEILQSSDDPTFQAAQALKAVGLPETWVYHLARPSTMLGDFIDPLRSALLDHRAEYGLRRSAKIGDTGFAGRGNKQAYDQELLPIIEELRGQMDTLPEHLRGYAHDYLDFYAKGGEFYMEPSKNPVIRTASNVIGKWAVFNPFIALGNVFEFMPKAVALYGTRNTARGVQRYMQATKGRFWERVPELDQLGIYGEEPTGLLRFNYVDAFENPLRGLSYYVGEAAGAGQGFEGISQIAYVYQPGDVPFVMRELDTRQSVALMRFSLEASKQYAGWVGNIINGVRANNTEKALEGLKALLLFESIVAMQTGVSAAIPDPIWNFLDSDAQEGIRDFEREYLPTNLMEKATGFDISDKTRVAPVGIRFGIGMDMLNGLLDSTSRRAVKISENMTEEDYTRAGLEFAKMFLDLSMTSSKAPGLNMTTKKLFEIIGDVLLEEKSPEEGTTEAIERSFGVKAYRD